MRAEAAWPLIIILGAGLVIRLAILPLFDSHTLHVSDERDYNALAKNLVLGNGFAYKVGRPTSIRPPLYPAFVAAVYSLCGMNNFFVVRLCQIVLSVLTAFLIYLAGREMYNDRVGMLASGLYSFYPSFVFYPGLILTEIIFTFFVVLFVYLMVMYFKHESRFCIGLAGMVLAMAALTRSVLWLFPVVLLPLVAIGKGQSSRGGPGKHLLDGAVLLLCFILVLSPWSIRNTRLQKVFTAVDTMGGMNFRMGNYRYTPDDRAWDAVNVTGEKSWYYDMRSLPPSERDTEGKREKWALRKGLEFIAQNPGLTFKRDVLKFASFWGLERELVAAAGRGFYGAIPMPAILLLTLFIFGSYAFVTITAVLGAVLAPPQDRNAHMLILLLIGFVCGIHTVVFGHSRYHLPLMPLVMLYSSNAMLNARQIWGAAMEGVRPKVVLASVVCVALVLFWLREILIVDAEKFLAILRR